MIELLAAIFVFLCAFIVHVILHRVQKKLKHPTLTVVIVYPGFLLLLFVLLWYLPNFTNNSIKLSNDRLTMVPILMYILLSCLSVILYAPFLLTGQVPAGTILAAFGQKNKLSKTEILALFSEDELIKPRFKSLIKTGMVALKNDKYFLTPQGRIVHGLVRFVEISLGIPIGG